jgi:hypothetical protein
VTALTEEFFAFDCLKSSQLFGAVEEALSRRRG